MNFVTHTLVRNGQPFIEPVLMQVLPYANRCLITISDKSGDGTLDVLRRIEKQYPNKVRIDFENVVTPADLTLERQKQIEKSLEDWILFLDDDDYWLKESIISIMKRFEEDVDALAVNPYQVVNESYHDESWRNKWFTKWFKNTPEVHYRGGWPRDLIYKGDELLYWRTNPRVEKIPERFFHLSYLKKWSFRNEPWAKAYKQEVGAMKAFPEEVRKEVWRIYGYIGTNK